MPHTDYRHNSAASSSVLNAAHTQKSLSSDTMNSDSHIATGGTGPTAHIVTGPIDHTQRTDAQNYFVPDIQLTMADTQNIIDT